MATLKITFYGDRGPDGYPMEGTVYRFYCDRCGSFYISRFIPPATRLGLILACVLGGIVWQRLGSLGSARTSGVDWLAWWFAFALLCLLLLCAVIAFHGHKCYKCGNTAITNLDVLDYSRRDNLTYDVPLERIHAHERLRNRWYKELFHLLAMAAMVPVIMLAFFVIEIAMVLVLVVSVFRSKETRHQGPQNK